MLGPRRGCNGAPGHPGFSKNRACPDHHPAATSIGISAAICAHLRQGDDGGGACAAKSDRRARTFGRASHFCPRGASGAAHYAPRAPPTSAPTTPGRRSPGAAAR
jgi:hypothetical protein